MFIVATGIIQYWADKIKAKNVGNIISNNIDENGNDDTDNAFVAILIQHLIPSSFPLRSSPDNDNVVKFD